MYCLVVEALPIHDSSMRKAMNPTSHSSGSSNKESSKPAIPCFGLLVVLLLCLASPSSSCNEQERSSLLQFLTGLSQDGGLAVSWHNDTNCCAWIGITCNRNGEVVEVSLAARGLEGFISPSLGNLTRLLRLNLTYNSLSGSLPLELMSSGSIVVLDVSFNRLQGDLQELNSSASDQPMKVLNISSNLFMGEFPYATWEKMTNLVVLNASNNSFGGSMPSSFCVNSKSLAVLDLCYNQFGGKIPPGLGQCSALRVLKIGHNNLSGTLPDELFNATMLEHLSLSNNYLEGNLDGANVTKLHNLAILDLGGNNVGGTIPHSIGQLKRLEELHLDTNNISGELPSALSSCTNLKIVDLRCNNFTGELNDVNFSSMPNLEVLDLMLNDFTGTIPESIYSCSNLIALRLSYNNFYGQLSPKIGNLESLLFLSITSNSFVNITCALQILKNSRSLTTLLMAMNFLGEVMPEDEMIDGFQNLKVLSIARCSLSGQIPLWISKLTNLVILNLSGNQLFGQIPVWINTLHFLYYLDISNNMLTGELPTTLMEMPMLKSEMFPPVHFVKRTYGLPIYMGLSQRYCRIFAFPAVLNIGNNGFIGTIPPTIGQLKVLLVLNLSSNNLHGGIPQSISNLTNLQVLDLSNNQLTGAIPVILNNLHFLSTFNISNNNLEGPVPTGDQFGTFSSSSFDGNPKLCGSMIIHRCDSAKASPVFTLSTEQTSEKVISSTAFGIFFILGVLYDQIVLSRFFG